MPSYYSPKEVAVAIGVSESSLKRWVDKGKIRAMKTAGGHRRLALSDVLNFIRQSARGLSEAAAIGLPEGCGLASQDVEGSQTAFLAALRSGEEDVALRVILDAFLSGVSVATICDRIVADAFHEIGDLWKCGDVKVYEERRACEISSRLVHELRRAIGDGPEEGAIALGGTLEHDPYTVAAGMAELVLRDRGWRATLLGNALPFDSVRTAIVDMKPALFWLSVTAVNDADKFAADFNLLFDVAQSTSTALVVGGQGLVAELRQKIRCTQVFNNFRELELFADTLPLPQR